MFVERRHLVAGEAKAVLPDRSRARAAEVRDLENPPADQLRVAISVHIQCKWIGLAPQVKKALVESTRFDSGA
jgi:hypothetical protein